MQYVLDSNNYIAALSFDSSFTYKEKSSITYTGSIPEGYSSLEEWYTLEDKRYNAWRIVDNTLVFDNNRYAILRDVYEKEHKDYSPVLHNELYSLEEKIDGVLIDQSEGYIKSNREGKIIDISNVRKCFPKIKVTNIDCYEFSTINIIQTKKNMLFNEAYSRTIDGLTFIQNEDRSITINGTSIKNIEYIISGSNSNISPFLCLKKNTNYYLSGLESIEIELLYYDGKDTTQVYKGTGGIIRFTDSERRVTEILLSIPVNTEFNNVTVYPQLEYGTTYSEYETCELRKYSYDFSKYVVPKLYPSETLFPKEDLYPFESIIDYIYLEIHNSSISVNGSIKEIDVDISSLFSGENILYTLEDTYLEVEYITNELDVDNLDFLCGKETTNKQFKILDDASIQVNNIYMYSGAKVIGGDGLLTNLQYVSGPELEFLGFRADENYTPVENYYENIIINANIPSNFKVDSAIITLIHSPVNYLNDMGTTENYFWGYSRNIKVYTNENLNNFYKKAVLFSSLYKEGGGELNEIVNAFGESGFTAKVPSDNAHETETVYSSDIKDYLLEGWNRITIKSDAAIPYNSDFEQNAVLCARSTGTAIAILNINGYMSYK